MIRERNKQKLLKEFAIPEAWTESGTPDRYAAVAIVSNGSGGSFQTAPTLESAFQLIGEAILDGFAADGVYDLDTGDKLEVHVATPAVSRSEDQGITINPLEPCPPVSIVERATQAALAVLDPGLERATAGRVPQVARERCERGVQEAMRVLVTDLHALLHPDQHPGYDPDHVYWQDKSDDEIATLSQRRARAAELWAPVARLYRSGWIQDGDRAASVAQAQIAALGDIEAYCWDQSTIGLVAEWIDAAREAVADVAAGER